MRRIMIVNFETTQGEFAFVKPNQRVSDHVFIGFVSDLTEEDWSKVVNKYYYYNMETEKCDKLYYENYINRVEYCDFKTATESGESLMKSLKLEGDNWLLIKYL